MNNEALVAILGLGKRHFCQTVRAAAVCAGKMRVALCFAAIMGQLEVPRSILDEGLVYEARLREAFERSVDCDFVELILAEPFGDLVLSQGFFGLEQHFHHGDPACGAVELRRFQHPTCLAIGIGFHCSASFRLWWPHPIASTESAKIKGKAMSLIQHGSQTATKRNAKLPASLGSEILPPKAMIM